MRLSFVRVLPALVLLLAACSEQKKPAAEKPAPAPAAAPAKPDSVATAPPAPAAPDTTELQDVAAYMAGSQVSCQSALRPLTASPAWQAFAADADKSWEKYHQTRTSKIQQWAATELDSVRAASPTIFYPFSGPDLLNVVTMFPTSQTYVLMGLEPIGTVPSASTLANPKLYPALKASLWSVLNFSFFRTNDMAVELNSRKPDSNALRKANSILKTAAKTNQRVNIGGVVPLLLLFAARTDHQVETLRYVVLSPDGQLTEADSATAQKPGLNVVPGVELKLRGKDGGEKTVVYLSADISDWKLGLTKEAALKYVRSLGPVTTYVKSATYLMHKSYFSKVRNLVLERSNYVLQDDSGIAMKYFRPADWKFTYYGTYKRPINLFAKQYQPALTRAYADSTNKARPLPFGTGYNWRQNDSNLLLAKRRTAPAS
ncbi:hypothetical protein [Hymenobacter chitinivorans]|uniref:Uncharacterized protein n=1 Tax=Hymenobacter chitinivorans DSM 11115 TaxID=1121954 RepID=A0A2M9ASZ6_9BACT|nr:hypothetical protein [Hymenobacter chitinivorans]PJJ48839.1 hypothetical protein CLV45_4552 [Hymenobacter chitinivorans DSM 11115]